MKNQYAGDVGDYTKLGVLRAIEKAGLSIGLNWYLTPDEPKHSKTKTDGKHTDYLECDCDTPDIELHCALKKIGLSNNRICKPMNSDSNEAFLFLTKCLIDPEKPDEIYFE